MDSMLLSYMLTRLYANPPKLAPGHTPQRQVSVILRIDEPRLATETALAQVHANTIFHAQALKTEGNTIGNGGEGGA